MTKDETLKLVEQIREQSAQMEATLWDKLFDNICELLDCMNRAEKSEKGGK